MASDGEFNALPDAGDALNKAMSQLIRAAAFKVMAAAQRDAPVDTGFLKNSIYVVTANESTYAQDAGAVPDGAALLPEIDPPTSDTSAYVAVGASYGVYQEFGTHNQPGHPYLTPAADAVRAELADHIGGQLEGMLKQLLRL